MPGAKTHARYVAAIGVLHLIENRLEVAAAGLQWTSFSRLPRSILAIAAGADFEHLALSIGRTVRYRSIKAYLTGAKAESW